MNSIPQQLVREAVLQFGTPLWLYDADVIRRKIASLRRFDVIRYAQKASSNIHILQLMRNEGLEVDAVSHGELERSFAAGFDPTQIVFTADIIDRPTLATIATRGIQVNVGSLDMLSRIGDAVPGHPVWLRINPGFGHGHSRKTNTGGENSKHGLWLSDMPIALKIIDNANLRLVGLHMHIGSGADYAHLSRVCGAMVDAVKTLGRDIKAISAGGGLSIPYTKDQAEIDTDHYFHLWDSARREIETTLEHSISLEIEPGRYLVGESGILVSEIHAIKKTPRHDFVLLDAGFNDLMRSALYGSYHEVSLVPQDATSLEQAPTASVAIAGPLCEAGDVFTTNADGVIYGYQIPQPYVGDLLQFHDVGAYGASMSSNYNSRPLAPEILVDGGELRLIRRRQNINDLLALER